MDPGVGIVKVRQGLGEIILRFLIGIFSIAVLILSSITVNHVEDKFVSSLPETTNRLLKTLIDVDYNQLYQQSVIGSSIIIGLTSLIILYEVLIIIIRFVNISIINKKINAFIVVDAVISFLLGVLMGVCSVLVAYAASQWSKVNNNNFFEELKQFGITIVLQEVVKARDLLSAMAAISLGEAILLASLLVWMIIVLFKNCNSISKKCYKNLN